jgi:PAS domain S-box-containing protein
VLKARFGMVSNYDDMSRATDAMALRECLQTGAFALSAAESATLAAALDAYSAAFEEKRARVESFKSENAVLRNSLQYFPMAIDNVASLASAGDVDAGLSMRVTRLQRDTLLFGLRGHSEHRAAIESDIAALSQAEAPPEVRDALNVALVHARSIIEHKSGADTLLTNVLSLPTQARGEALSSLYGSMHSMAVHVCDGYRLGLFMACVSLVGWCGWFMFKLRRSAAELSRANETLEQRVADRTTELAGIIQELQVEIDERAAAEEALRQSESRFRSVANSAHDAIVAADAEGMIFSWNPAAQRMFGHAAEEIIGQPLTTLIPERYREGHDAGMARRRTMPGELGRTVEVNGLHKDGREFPVELSLGRWGEGEHTMFSGVLRDITDRKRVEAIERERRSLEEAVTAMEQVLGVVGHELRTPLAGVRAMSEFLMGELECSVDSGESHCTFLRRINEEVVRMSDMVNNLLEAARLNSGAARWQWSTFRLSDVCADALETIRPLTDADAVTLKQEMPEADVEMQGDEDAVRRLILNLLRNAQKHTPSGHILLRAAEISDIDGNRAVEIEIEDTGEGIPPEIAEKLGQAFALNAGTVGSASVTGSGLGLAICKGIVAAHGGSMSIRSQRGCGTTVRIVLRADLAEAIQHSEVGILKEIEA